jgi:hypothetical protein
MKAESWRGGETWGKAKEKPRKGFDFFGKNDKKKEGTKGEGFDSNEGRS